MSDDESTERDLPALRVEVVAGGDPGDAVLAAVATILTRPVVVLAASTDDGDEAERASHWTRAARLEGIVPGRRITTRADLAWRRTA